MRDRDGRLIDTSCECDMDSPCNYPPCVMANDLIGRDMRRLWEGERLAGLIDEES